VTNAIHYHWLSGITVKRRI